MEMDDAISRNSLIHDIEAGCPRTPGDCCVICKKHQKRTAFDAVSVVRCKNCDLWNRWDSAGSEKAGTLVCSCAYWTAEDGPVHYTMPDDFCSNGERMEAGL